MAALAITPAIVQAISAAAAVASTALAVTSAQGQRSNAAHAKDLARQRAMADTLQANAEYRQQRSLVSRRLAQQVDAGRVTSAAAGVSGGASGLVLESAYAQDARTDLATLSANRFYRSLGINAGLNNDMARIDSQTPNVGMAALGGVLQGIGTYMNVGQGLDAMQRESARQAAQQASQQTAPSFDYAGTNDAVVNGGIYGPATT